MNPPPQAAGYSLVASTNFKPLDLSPDGKGDHIWYNPGATSFMSPVPAPMGNITVVNGVLELTWTKGQPNPWTAICSAAQDASFYRAWRYGYFEVTMAWEPVPGAWPAIWMRPIQYTKNPSVEAGELDIFEGQGATPELFYGTIWDWSKAGQGSHNKNGIATLPSSFNSAQFHKYGLLWMPGKVTWYLDEASLISASTPKIFDQQDYSLILAMQMGQGGYGIAPPGTPDRFSMRVQSVNVWQKEGK